MMLSRYEDKTEFVECEFQVPITAGQRNVYEPKIKLILVSTFVVNTIAFPIGAIGYQSFTRQSRDLEVTKRKHIRQSALTYLSY